MRSVIPLDQGVRGTTGSGGSVIPLDQGVRETTGSGGSVRPLDHEVRRSALLSPHEGERPNISAKPDWLLPNIPQDPRGVIGQKRRL